MAGDEDASSENDFDRLDNFFLRNVLNPKSSVVDTLETSVQVQVRPGDEQVGEVNAWV